MLSAAALGAFAAAPAQALQPRIDYMLQCLGCHGPDGQGEPDHVPSIGATLAPLARLAEGRRYLVQVPGVAQSSLSDADLARLLNWTIATLGQAAPGSFRAFTAAEVGRYRHTPLVAVHETRARLMRQLPLASQRP